MEENIDVRAIFENVDLETEKILIEKGVKQGLGYIHIKCEILECIRNSNYKDIKLVPNLNSGALWAFMLEIDKTKILLRPYINQFLENEDPTFFSEAENLETCKMLLDPTYKSILDISDCRAKRINSIVQEKMSMNYNKSKLVESAISATVDVTRTGQIDSQVSQIIEYQSEQDRSLE